MMMKWTKGLETIIDLRRSDN